MNKKNSTSAGGQDAVIAVTRINGTILPGTYVLPADDEQRAELFALKAVREPSEEEQALFTVSGGDIAVSIPKKGAKAGKSAGAKAAAGDAGNDGADAGGAAGDSQIG